MNSRELILEMLQGKPISRPLFCPAIYEHKARLINQPVSIVACTGSLLYDAIMAEYEIYKPDMLTVGVDIYNVEAEALGGAISFSSSARDVPSIGKHIFERVDSYKNLELPSPGKSGRMPLMLEVAHQIYKKLGDMVMVRGAVSGPFSIAAQLLGVEKLLLSCMNEVAVVAGLLGFCSRVCLDYAKAFLEQGVQVCIFDSQLAPPFISPQMYSTLILPHVRSIISALHAQGAVCVEYVVGGDTSQNVDNLLSTGADIILSDYNSNVEKFISAVANKPTLLRRNIDPVIIELGSEKQIRDCVGAVCELYAKHPRTLIGTGVLSYDVSSERILSIKKMIFDGERYAK